MLTPGSQLLRGYLIERVLGQGGMGTVYLARQTNLGDRRVALKEVHLEASTAESQARLVDLLKREATIIASLEHPALVRVIEFFEEAGTHYFAMEFIDGMSLQDCLAKGRVEIAQALNWIDQVLDTLTWLHERQPPVIVRDLKPSNLMLDAAGRVRIIDFGIAGIQDGSRTQTVLKGAGTMGYAPAEQFGMTGAVDARSDIYAVGATLYSLVTGEVPPFALDLATGDAELILPTDLNPQVSGELEAVILKMMALKRDYRYATAREARQSLSQATTGATQAPASQPADPATEVPSPPTPAPPLIAAAPRDAVVATADPESTPGGAVLLKSRATELAPYAAELAPLGFTLKGDELFGPGFWCQRKKIGIGVRSLSTLDYKVELAGCPPELNIMARGPLTLKMSSTARAAAIPTGDADFDGSCLVFCSDRQLALDYLTPERRRFLLTCLPGLPLEIKGAMVTGHWTMDSSLDKYLQPLVRMRSLHNPPAVELPAAGWVARGKSVGASKPLGCWAGILTVALFLLQPFRLPDPSRPSVVAMIICWFIGVGVCLATMILASRISKGGGSSLARTALWMNRLYMLVLFVLLGAFLGSNVGIIAGIMAAGMTFGIPALIYFVFDRIASEAID